MTTLEERPTAEALPQAEPGLEHFVCCLHEHHTYCGKYDPSEIQGIADRVNCADCDDHGEDEDFCPVYVRCRMPFI